VNRRAAGARVLTGALVAFALPAAGAEAARPDLKVAALSPLTPAVTPNEQVRAQVTVRNAGKVSSPASSVRLYLSRDGRKGKSDKRFSGKAAVKALKPGKRARTTVKGNLPRGAAPGGYRLIACTDAIKREGKKGNNCKAAPFGVTTAAQRVSVTPALETAAAFDGILTVDSGGTLAAIGADGTLYYLVVPPDALTHDQRVTMTPVAAIQGLPLSGGLVAAVQVGDDSFQLAKAAQLVIRRDGLAPSASQVGFGYHNGGEDFFLTPFGDRPAGFPSDSITIPVLHGGGYGVANASAEEVATQRAKPPARAEDRLAQAATAQGAPAKRAARVRPAGVDIDAVLAAGRNVYEQRIAPSMKAAETNDALWREAIDEGTGWMREVALLHELGLVQLDDFQKEFDQITDSIEKIIRNAYAKARERCLDGDFRQIARLVAVYQFTERVVPGISFAFDEDFADCWRFELRVTSHLEVHEDTGDGNSVDQVSELQSTVPLAYDIDVRDLAGQAPFEYRQFTYDAKVNSGLCNATGTVQHTGTLQDGQLDVFRASVSSGDPGAKPSAPVITMLIEPGQPGEELREQGQGCGGSYDETRFEQRWLEEWRTLFHLPDEVEFQGGGRGWFFDEFKPGAKPIVGTRTFTLVAGARTLDETWTVVHTPRRR
jgi:hypothetical protein